MNVWATAKLWTALCISAVLLVMCIESVCVLWFSAGDMYEVGAESGRYYCLNVPLRDGIDDQSELTSHILSVLVIVTAGR